MKRICVERWAIIGVFLISFVVAGLGTGGAQDSDTLFNTGTAHLKEGKFDEISRKAADFMKTIQNSISNAGFVVAQVSTLDRGAKSFNQIK